MRDAALQANALYQSKAWEEKAALAGSDLMKAAYLHQARVWQDIAIAYGSPERAVKRWSK